MTQSEELQQDTKHAFKKEDMDIPKRKGLISMPMPKDAEEVKSVVRVGGYYYWNWKFPFRHFEKEKLLIATKNCIYETIL